MSWYHTLYKESSISIQAKQTTTVSKGKKKKQVGTHRARIQDYISQLETRGVQGSAHVPQNKRPQGPTVDLSQPTKKKKKAALIIEQVIQSRSSSPSPSPPSPAPTPVSPPILAPAFAARVAAAASVESSAHHSLEVVTISPSHPESAQVLPSLFSPSVTSVGTSSKFLTHLE